MRTEAKRLFFHFIRRISMYLPVEDENNIISFVHGYEMRDLGIENSGLIRNIEKLAIEKYKVKLQSDGWRGQIRRISEKLSISWVVAFKRMTLKLIVNEFDSPLEPEIRDLLREAVFSLVKGIGNNTHRNQKHLKEEWELFFSLESKVFKRLWTNEEYKVLKLINLEIQKVDILSERQIINSKLEELRTKYLKLKIKDT